MVSAVSWAVLLAQDVRVVMYNAGNGLPTDMIKSTFQDKQGFIWIATDNGLLRFDGKRCQSFTNLLSPYVKGLLQLPTGELIVVTDLGLMQVFDDRDSVRFVTLLRGSTMQTDSTLWYPKTLYCDRHGTLWLGEPNAIVRCTLTKVVPKKSNAVQNTQRATVSTMSFKRFRFDDTFSSDSFLRSFSFVEDKQGRLLAASQRGGALFCYDAAADRFSRLPVAMPTESPFRVISSMIQRADSSMWIATDKGVFKTIFSPKTSTWQWRLVVSLPEVSVLAEDAQGMLYAGTWFAGMYRIDRTNAVEKLPLVSSNTINEIRVDHTGSLWASADDGLTLLQPTLLNRLRVPLQRPYIQHVTLAPDGSVVVTDGVSIVAVNSTPLHPAEYALRSFPYQRYMQHDETSGILMSIAFHQRPSTSPTPSPTTLYGTSRGLLGVLDQTTRHQAQETRLLPELGDFALFHLLSDSKARVWVPVPRTQEIVCVQDAGKQDATGLGVPTLERYGRGKGVYSPVNVLRQAPFGTIYAGGADSVLFYELQEQTRAFTPVKVKLPFTPAAPLVVNDMAIAQDSTVWLGTNCGVVRYKQGVADTIAVSREIARQNITSVRVAANGTLFFTTEQTLNFYVNNELLTLNLRSGNSTMTTTYRNMVIDRYGQLWLGTTQGVLFLPSSAMDYKVTPQPVFVSLKVGGKAVSVNIGQGAPSYLSGSYIEAVYAALSYPSDKIRYQTRLINTGALRADTAWSESSYDAFTIVPSLRPGSYKLHVRAQQAGLLWSAPVEYAFTVYPPWYATWTAFGLYAVAFAGIVYGVSQWRSQRLERKNTVLKKIVAERTAEIERQMAILDEQAREIELANTQLHEQNGQLQTLNNEKNEFLGMAAHDLKNPLTSIMMNASMTRQYIGRMKTDDVLTQMEHIERTARRMRDIVANLLDINAIESGKFRFELKPVNVAELVQGVVEDYQPRAQEKSLKLTLDFELQDSPMLVVADAAALVEVVENLVSNAVKYSPRNKNVWVRIRQHSAPQQPSVQTDTVHNAVHRTWILVQDEGQGLTEDDKSKLFGKFARLSARPTGGEHSTGLGLSIVKRMVEAMGGTVRCESEYGNGATFIVELPTAHQSGAETNAAEHTKDNK
jgi:signal transduction histidine kinase